MFVSPRRTVVGICILSSFIIVGVTSYFVSSYIMAVFLGVLLLITLVELATMLSFAWDEAKSKATDIIVWYSLETLIVILSSKAIWSYAAIVDGAVVTLYVIIVVFLTDAAAFGFGRAFGRSREKPLFACSPKKTIEGTTGGIAAGLLFAAGLALVLGILGFPSFTSITDFFYLSKWPLIPFLAIAGDLIESKTKRVANLKDSGELLRDTPNPLRPFERFIASHGGVLDRIDSFIIVFAVLAVI